MLQETKVVLFSRHWYVPASP